MLEALHKIWMPAYVQLVSENVERSASHASVHHLLTYGENTRLDPRIDSLRSSALGVIGRIFPQLIGNTIELKLPLFAQILLVLFELILSPRK